MADPIDTILDDGGTGDYENFADGMTGHMGATSKDLISEDEVVDVQVKSSAGGRINPGGFADLNGFTSDATRFVTIRGASGFRHNGRYNATSSEGIARFDTTTDASLLLQDPYTVAKDLLVIQRNTTGYPSGLYLNADGCSAERCLVVTHPNPGGAECYTINFGTTGNPSYVVRNCVIITMTGSFSGRSFTLYYDNVATTGTITLENCTLINLNPQGTYPGAGVLLRGSDDVILKNCAIWAPNPVYSSGGPHNLATGSTNNAYVGAGGGNDVDLTGYTIYDVFVDPDNYDFRPRKGSPLRGAGADLSGTFTDDIVGNQRPASGAYDIGAFQYAAGGGERKRFVVSLPSSATHRVEGVSSMVIEADSPEAARDRAAVEFDGDSSWDSAEALELEDTEFYEGALFEIVLEGLLSVSYTAQQGDTIDDIGDALAAALNARQPIQGAVHNSATHVLTIAETTDGLGDKTVGVRVTPAGAKRPLQAISGPVGTVTDKGLSSAALKVEFRDSGVPRVISRQ
jgi:hypothetical protein